MNARILELAAQAGFDVERLMAPHPGGFPREDMLALEGFAELIVQECIGVIGEENYAMLTGKAYCTRLKRHFGVDK